MIGLRNGATQFRVKIQSELIMAHKAFRIKLLDGMLETNIS